MRQRNAKIYVYALTILSLFLIAYFAFIK